MNVSTLCDRIELQPQLKKSVLSFLEGFDYQKVEKLQEGYFSYVDMKANLENTRDLLGEDENGVKILSCMLEAAARAYDVYQVKGISDEIYFATMRCFTRFIDETNKMTGKWCFDRWWWTTRQVGCHLFRIGALEYEIEQIDGDVFIGLHIPSDVDFSPGAVEQSLREAKAFFEKYDPTLGEVKYRCHSWLLEPKLGDMLSPGSNIASFRNRFEIYDEGEVDTEFLQWLFQTKSTDYAALPENTSLQKQVKKHLQAGGVIRNAYGELIWEI